MRVTALSLFLCLAAFIAGGPSPARATPIIVPEPNPVAAELAYSDLFVVVGRLYDAKPDANDGRGTTEVAILTVIKDQPFLKDKKHFTMKRYMPVAADVPNCWILFGVLFKGEVDIYRGHKCSGKHDAFPEYVKGILQQEKASMIDKLSFYFGHLEHRNSDIALDAFRFYCTASYDNLKGASQNFDAKKLDGWIADKNVPDRRRELYRVLLLLGQSGPKR